MPEKKGGSRKKDSDQLGPTIIERFRSKTERDRRKVGGGGLNKLNCDSQRDSSGEKKKVRGGSSSSYMGKGNVEKAYQKERTEERLIQRRDGFS